MNITGADIGTIVEVVFEGRLIKLTDPDGLAHVSLGTDDHGPVMRVSPAQLYPVNPRLPGAHKHEFTIPVEWAIVPDTDKMGNQLTTDAGRRVTKLRCRCGEETERA